MEDFLCLSEVNLSLLRDIKNGNELSFFLKLGSWITLPAKVKKG